MTLFLLSTQYRERFVDNQKYAGRVAVHLAGLASAIEDSSQTWRPNTSELVRMLPKSERSNSIVAAGMAYGAGKSIMTSYPGPAILLFGAALNVIGNATNIELQTVIERAETKLASSSLSEDEDIKTLLQAAKERASFDKVSQMLRDEFAQGLMATGRYTHDFVNAIVRKIVNVTHDVRHRGLIERIEWKNIKIEVGSTSTNTGYMHDIDEIIFGDDKLQELLAYAREGCAFSILRKLTTSS